jgi:hypothetical protein
VIGYRVAMWITRTAMAAATDKTMVTTNVALEFMPGETATSVPHTPAPSPLDARSSAGPVPGCQLNEECTGRVNRTGDEKYFTRHNVSETEIPRRGNKAAYCKETEKPRVAIHAEFYA